MSISRFSAAKTGDREVDKNFQQLESVLNPAIEGGLLNGRFISATTLFPDETLRLHHGLGRKVRGWVVVDRTSQLSDERMWRSESRFPDRELLIEVVGGAAGNNLTFWVF